MNVHLQVLHLMIGSSNLGKDEVMAYIMIILLMSHLIGIKNKVLNPNLD